MQVSPPTNAVPSDVSCDVGFISPVDVRYPSLPRSPTPPGKSTTMRVPHCEFLYITGFKRQRIGEIRKLLGPQGMGIKLRTIINLSWVTNTILEAIVLVESVEKIRGILNRQAGVYLIPHYDPLVMGNFPWPRDLLPESKLSLLEQSMITRYAKSWVASSNIKTRLFLDDLLEDRGWTAAFQMEIVRQMTKSTYPSSSDEELPTLSSSDHGSQDFTEEEQSLPDHVHGCITIPGPANPNSLLSLTNNPSSLGDAHGARSE